MAHVNLPGLLGGRRWGYRHLLGDVEGAAEEIVTTWVTQVRNSRNYTPKQLFQQKKPPEGCGHQVVGVWQDRVLPVLQLHVLPCACCFLYGFSKTSFSSDTCPLEQLVFPPCDLFLTDSLSSYRSLLY